MFGSTTPRGCSSTGLLNRSWHPEVGRTASHIHKLCGIFWRQKGFHRTRSGSKTAPNLPTRTLCTAPRFYGNTASHELPWLLTRGACSALRPVSGNKGWRLCPLHSAFTTWISPSKTSCQRGEPLNPMARLFTHSSACSGTGSADGFSGGSGALMSAAAPAVTDRTLRTRLIFLSARTAFSLHSPHGIHQLD